MPFFKKLLIANRGEIAVRITRTCRELNIPTVAFYEAVDSSSLHLREADECVLLDSPRGFMDAAAIWEIAQNKQVDAIHPGYGFLAESPEFSRACQEAGITCIGPTASVLDMARDKIGTLSKVRAAGFKTVENSASCYSEEGDVLKCDALQLGFPLIIKSCLGGRGRGERLVRSPGELDRAFKVAQAESLAVYGAPQVFFEKAIVPAHQVGVQILADGAGYLHLGEREGSLFLGGHIVLEESPAPCLDDRQRTCLWETALAIARLLQLRGVVTIEFLVDEQGVFYFTEVKPRIPIEHPLTEFRTRLDLVHEQMRLAAGEPLNMKQEEVHLQGWAMLCRINAHDPQQNFLPSPGRVRQVRFPNGPETRVDTFIYSGAVVPDKYDALVAKLSVWGLDRPRCLDRLTRALDECQFNGIVTNTPWLKQLVRETSVREGTYSTDNDTDESKTRVLDTPQVRRDLAAAAALLYLKANELSRATTPERLARNWHRSSRRLPENV